ncbi:hypothetical protein A2U01_0101096, partial [Trifolium medium]|nr:hypothetical protein [Trifolium medium]
MEVLDLKSGCINLDDYVDEFVVFVENIAS